MTHGPNYTVKISREIASEEEIYDNFMEILPNFIGHITKWGIDLKELKTISIKGRNAVDLPVYTQLTEEEMKAYLEK